MVVPVSLGVACVARTAVERFSTPDELQLAVLAAVSRELATATGRDDGARLFLRDPTARSWTLAEAREENGGLPREIAIETARFAERVAATRRPTLEDNRVGLPLLLGDDLLGVLELTFADPDAAASDLEPLQAIADVLALTIKGSRAAAHHRELSNRMARGPAVNRAILDALEVVPEFQLQVALLRGFHLWPYAREQRVPEFLRGALGTIVEQIRAAVGAQFGALGIERAPDLPFDPWVFAGIGEQQVAAAGRVPRPIGVLGLVAKECEVVRVRDVRTHPAFQGFPPHHPEMTSFLALPIRYGQTCIGAIYLANKIGALEFTAEDEYIVGAMTTHVGQALQIAYLRAAIEAQRAQLQCILDCAPSAILFVDAVDEHVMANPRAMHLLGRAIIPEAGMSQYQEFVCHPDGRPAAPDESLARAALRGETVRNVEALICVEGQRVPVLVSASPVRTIENRILGAVVVFEEISALKELERVRTEFATMIAHDFRAPIQVIELLVSMLLRSADENPGHIPAATLRRIQRSVTRLTHKTNDLLDASRTELKRFSLECQSVAADQLTTEIVDQLRPVVEGHSIEVSAEAGLPRVLVDPLRFDQILTNLIDNAAKHSAKETPISIHLASSAGGLLISVQDRGVGIPAGDLPKLFDRYFQARLSSVKKTGLGLGLYIVKGLVEAQGGRIWVESRVGEGSTFYLWFPAEPPMA